MKIYKRKEGKAENMENMRNKLLKLEGLCLWSYIKKGEEYTKNKLTKR